MVVEHHLIETFLGVDGEAVILREVAGHSIIADEVRHGTRSIRAEHVLRGLGGLEKDVAVAVAVQLACALTSVTEVVTTLQPCRKVPKMSTIESA